MELNEKQAKVWGKGTMVIPAPREVEEVMKKVLKGKLITINRIRESLAKKHKTTTCCPICTGIFSNLVAQAAEEELKEGKKGITPYWRTLKGEGELNPKYPGGVEEQAKKLKAEGYKITQKGKKWLVEGFVKSLVK